MPLDPCPQLAVAPDSAITRLLLDEYWARLSEAKASFRAAVRESEKRLEESFALLARTRPTPFNLEQPLGRWQRLAGPVQQSMRWVRPSR